MLGVGATKVPSLHEFRPHFWVVPGLGCRVNRGQHVGWGCIARGSGKLPCPRTILRSLAQDVMRGCENRDQAFDQIGLLNPIVPLK